MSEMPLINHRIREARISLKLTQQHVADALELNQSTISQIEQGKKYVSSEEIVAFSNLFGLDISYFVDEESEDIKETVLTRLYGKSIHTSDKLAIAKFRKLYRNYRKLLDIKKD